MLNKEEVSLKMSTFEQIKTSLYESCRQRLPAFTNRTSSNTFLGRMDENSIWRVNSLAEDGSGEDKIVVFATDTNIKILCEV